LESNQLGAPAPADSTPALPNAESTSSAPPPAADAATEQLFEVKINGQVEKVPLKELLSGYSRHQDYTRKTQALAQREAEWNNRIQQYEQAFQEIYEFLSDRERLRQYLESLGAEQQQTDPSELATHSDLQKQIEMVQQRNQLLMMQQLQEMEQRLRVEQLTGEFSKQIDAKIQGIFQKYPDLKGIRGIERQLRFEVAQRQPQSLDDALQAFEEVAEALHADLTNVIKQKTVQASSSPLNNGIEPAGGQGPMPAAQPNFKSVKDARLRELVIQDLLKAQGTTT